MTNLTTTKLVRVSAGSEVSVTVLKAETEAGEVSTVGTA